MRPDRSVYLSSRLSAVMVLYLKIPRRVGRAARSGTERNPPSVAAGFAALSLPYADSIDLEQAGGAHAAADAHGDDAVFRAAALALDQDVAGHAGTRHAVGMADGDGTALHVEALRGNGEAGAA